MAILRDYETLMIKKKAKDAFRRAKALIEKDMDMELSHSQALIMMAQKIEIEYYELLPSSKSEVKQ
jgi:hypothetical protein